MRFSSTSWGRLAMRNCCEQGCYGTGAERDDGRGSGGERETETGGDGRFMMAYDRNGNWDYSDAEAEQMFRGRRRLASLRGGLRTAGIVGVVIVAFAALLALAAGSWYAAGRVIGAGVRDAQGPR